MSKAYTGPLTLLLVASAHAYLGYPPLDCPCCTTGVTSVTLRSSVFRTYERDIALFAPPRAGNVTVRVLTRDAIESGVELRTGCVLGCGGSPPHLAQPLTDRAPVLDPLFQVAHRTVHEVRLTPRTCAAGHVFGVELRKPHSRKAVVWATGIGENPYALDAMQLLLFPYALMQLHHMWNETYLVYFIYLSFAMVAAALLTRERLRTVGGVLILLSGSAYMASAIEKSHNLVRASVTDGLGLAIGLVSATELAPLILAALFYRWASRWRARIGLASMLLGAGTAFAFGSGHFVGPSLLFVGGLTLASSCVQIECV